MLYLVKKKLAREKKTLNGDAFQSLLLLLRFFYLKKKEKKRRKKKRQGVSMT